jgi:hypothetical protein
LIYFSIKSSNHRCMEKPRKIQKAPIRLKLKQ